MKVGGLDVRGRSAMPLTRPSAAMMRGWMGILVGPDGKATQVLFVGDAGKAPRKALRLSTARLRALVG